MDDIIYTLCFLFCCPLSSGLEKKDCNTTVEISPLQAGTSPGTQPDEALQVTCFTRFSSSSLLSSRFVSLTAGFLTTTTPAAGPTGNGSVSDALRDSDDEVQTVIAQLMTPREGPSRHEVSGGLLSHATLSSAFRNMNITARVQMSGSSMGLVVVFEKARDSCSSVSSHPFYCTAVHCHPSTNTNSSCTENVEETIVSQHLFVQGCEHEALRATPKPHTFPTTRCFRSTNVSGISDRDGHGAGFVAQKAKAVFIRDAERQPRFPSRNIWSDEDDVDDNDRSSLIMKGQDGRGCECGDGEG
ncbi:hypothetical protein ACOMHN_040151 [Nucella lapillus]